MCEDSTLVHSAFFCLSRPLFSTPFFFSQPFEHGCLGFVKSCGNSRVLNRWPSLSGALSGPLPQGAKPKRALSFHYYSEWKNENRSYELERAHLWGPTVISYLFTWQPSCSHCTFYWVQFSCGIEIQGWFSLTRLSFIPPGPLKEISKDPHWADLCLNEPGFNCYLEHWQILGSLCHAPPSGCPRILHARLWVFPSRPVLLRFQG